MSQALPDFVLSQNSLATVISWQLIAVYCSFVHLSTISTFKFLQVVVQVLVLDLIFHLTFSLSVALVDASEFQS